MSDLGVQNKAVFLSLKSSNITRINDLIFVTSGGFFSDLRGLGSPRGWREVIGTACWEDQRRAEVCHKGGWVTAGGGGAAVVPHLTMLHTPHRNQPFPNLSLIFLSVKWK